MRLISTVQLDLKLKSRGLDILNFLRPVPVTNAVFALVDSLDVN